VAGLYVLIKFVIVFLDIILLAMLVRAVMSWFVGIAGESPILNFLYVITEPLIIPVRMICHRFGWFQGLPVDIPFLITTFILCLISTLLMGISPL